MFKSAKQIYLRKVWRPCRRGGTGHVIRRVFHRIYQYIFAHFCLKGKPEPPSRGRSENFRARTAAIMKL